MSYVQRLIPSSDSGFSAFYHMLGPAMTDASQKSRIRIFNGGIGAARRKAFYRNIWLYDAYNVGFDFYLRSSQAYTARCIKTFNS